VSPPHCPDYAAIKAMAVEMKRPAKTLIAQSVARDPFYVTPARRDAAHWFAQAWPVLDPSKDDLHVRRMHYRYISLPEADRPPKRDGKPYENTEADWKDFCDASVDARILELVDPNRFTDRRAGEPVFIADDSGRDREAFIGCFRAWLTVPPAETSFVFECAPREFSFPDPPMPYVICPTFSKRYAIETWAEKSTMNDVLYPLARQNNVTLVTGVGDLSFTHCLWHVKRVLAHRKPTRILYISDFDPGGELMPVGVARKIEFLLRRDGHDLDIRLIPLVLTREQVDRYRLPRIPIKDTDARKRDFEKRHGEGAVELDALEALHPGELARIVEAAIERYREPTREATRANAAAELAARTAVVEARDAVLAEFGSEMAALREDFEAARAAVGAEQEALAEIAEQAAEQSRAHVAEIDARMGAFYDRANRVWMRMEARMRDRLPSAEDFEWAAAQPADDGEPLFDSTRGYLEQVDHYNAHFGRPTARRRRSRTGDSP